MQVIYVHISDLMVDICPNPKQISEFNWDNIVIIDLSIDEWWIPVNGKIHQNIYMHE
jgi:hypothetical protein